MAQFKYPFSFTEDDSSQVKGFLELDEPLPYRLNSQGSGLYRTGRISLEEGGGLELALYHSEATSAFIYTRSSRVDTNFLNIVGLSTRDISEKTSLTLPGQLCLGSDRTVLIKQAIRDVFSSPVIHQLVTGYRQHNLAIFPIAREGLKYQVAEALFDNFGYYCDEILLDAHHVFDRSVPVYNRKVELALFKDKDLNGEQHDNIRVAFIADSIASGLVMKEVIARVKERFDRIQHVEVVAPLATIRGLCRLARTENGQTSGARVHVFETLLNALAPDYYYSAHFNIPELHLRPNLEEEYRRWWGKDSHGNFIADTACAGYGWSEVFYSPRKQIQMINNELATRHDLSITDLIKRNCS